MSLLYYFNIIVSPWRKPTVRPKGKLTDWLTSYTDIYVYMYIDIYAHTHEIKRSGCGEGDNMIDYIIVQVLRTYK